VARYNGRSFVALLRNENPTTGKRLTARMNTSRQEDGETVSNRQVGYGLVFGIPKSVSIYLAITGDQVVENIARSAVDESMQALESEMQCKVRKGGLQEVRRTGELLYSKFFHRDSRPINGLVIHIGTSTASFTMQHLIRSKSDGKPASSGD
jgi:conjugative relaxase-like TrwC/TraI family protein